MADTYSTLLADTSLANSKPAGLSTATIGAVKTREKAMEVAKEFEALFIQEMLAPVFDQIDTDGPFGGGQAEKAFRPMLLEEYARNISESGGIGVADSVLTEILRMQGLE